MRACTVLFLLCCAHPLPAQLITKLLPETNRSFEEYIGAAEPALITKARSVSPLPWLQPGDVERVRKGEFVFAPISPKNGHDVPDGLIHDWIGGMFIPGVTVEKVAGVLQDFAHHKDWYPEVIDSKLLTHKDSTAQGMWLLLKKKFMTVVLRLDLDSQVHQVAPNHAYIVSHTGPVTEVANHGTPKEANFPPGEGHGFLWRFNGYWTLHQADGGVYAECRAISLSRGVPAGLGWIVSPMVRTMPRESLESSLRNTRKAAASR